MSKKAQNKVQAVTTKAAKETEQSILQSIALALFHGTVFANPSKAGIDLLCKLEQDGVVTYSKKLAGYTFAGKLAACSFIARKLAKGSVSQSECLRQYRATGKSVSDGQWNNCFHAMKDALAEELVKREQQAKVESKPVTKKVEEKATTKANTSKKEKASKKAA